MVQRIKTQQSVPFLILIIVALAIFTLLIGKHYEITQNKLRDLGLSAQNALVIGSAQAGITDPCGDGATLTIFSPTVYICNEEQNELVYDEIYNLYPVSADGREIIYTFIDEGEKERADEMLEDIYHIERYDPVTLPSPLTWTEDPYNERYWRFLFYSLRPIRHLLATAEETRAERYYEKTREIIESFIDNGLDKTHTWDDSHGVAFRTMILVNVWWELREAGELPGDLSDKILATLEVHGDFLVDPENYESEFNHAVTQSAALLLLAENFPDLANAETWRRTALQRINIGLTSIVDPNGMLNENSPYYHFYVLEKYWEIYKYARENSIELSDDFNETIVQMIDVGAYILRPDVSVPLLGASTPRTILRSGVYREMAEEYNEFDYVLTKGVSGRKPEHTNILFPSSGVAVMRSGWGEDRSFEDETYLVFDTGPYRTDHSHLDALTFSLFGLGAPIIRDTGLFTYETEHPYYNYFYGTRGHNTVMVDDTDQPQGSGEHQQLVDEEGYTYLSAWHELYPGVRHSRTIALIEDNAVLIADDLSSDTEHTYEQIFHLSPETEILDSTTSLKLHGTVKNDKGDIVPFSITQLIAPQGFERWLGENNPIRGYCADGYEVRVPCYEISYITKAEQARYVTYIHFGEDDFDITYDRDKSAVTLTNNETKAQYDIDILFPEDRLIDRSYIELAISAGGESDISLLNRIRSFLTEKF